MWQPQNSRWVSSRRPEPALQVVPQHREAELPAHGPGATRGRGSWILLCIYIYICFINVPASFKNNYWNKVAFKGLPTQEEVLWMEGEQTICSVDVTYFWLQWVTSGRWLPAKVAALHCLFCFYERDQAWEDFSHHLCTLCLHFSCYTLEQAPCLQDEQFHGPLLRLCPRPLHSFSALLLGFLPVQLLLDPALSFPPDPLVFAEQEMSVCHSRRNPLPVGSIFF